MLVHRDFVWWRELGVSISNRVGWLGGVERCEDWSLAALRLTSLRRLTRPHRDAGVGGQGRRHYEGRKEKVAFVRQQQGLFGYVQVPKKIEPLCK